MNYRPALLLYSWVRRLQGSLVWKLPLFGTQDVTTNAPPWLQWFGSDNVEVTQALHLSGIYMVKASPLPPMLLVVWGAVQHILDAG